MARWGRALGIGIALAVVLSTAGPLGAQTRSSPETPGARDGPAGGSGAAPAASSTPPASDVPAGAAGHTQGIAPAAAAAAPAAPEPPRERLTFIATGAVAGVYYNVGGSICRRMEDDLERHRLRCIVESSTGSAENLERVRTGQTEFGFVASDIHGMAWNGSGIFKDKGAQDWFRSVMSLHEEPYTVVTPDGSLIRSFDDLAGRRVDVSPPGSGTRITTDVVFGIKGWTSANFVSMTELHLERQADALCEGRLDAFITSFGHPSPILRRTATRCGISLVPVVGPLVDTLVGLDAGYHRTRIPGGLYLGVPDATATFGMRATLIAHRDVPDAIVRELVLAVLDHRGELARRHGMLDALEPERMGRDGLIAPMHPGARAAFREAGFPVD